MRAFAYLLVLAALAGHAIADTNATGKWSGSFNMIAQNAETPDSTAVLMLKQNGTEITGTVGPDEGEQHAITRGKIEGDKITLEAVDGEITIRFDLVLAADRITGDVNMLHNGQTARAKIDVTRAK